jgi:dihydrofolate reductase
MTSRHRSSSKRFTLPPGGTTPRSTSHRSSLYEGQGDSATTDPGWRNTWVLDVDPAQVAAQLRRQSGADVLVLSGRLISRLLAVDAVDRLAIVWCPELLGGGARLFEDDLPRSRWTPTSSTVSGTGADCTTYDRVR